MIPELWLLVASEPWTRYRTLVDLLGRSESDPEAAAARSEMLAHPQVRALIAAASTWGEDPFKRHNDASHLIYALSTLADFGLRADDPGMAEVIAKVMARQSLQGFFQSLVNIAPARTSGPGWPAMPPRFSTPCWRWAWARTSVSGGP